ncbi:MAG: insulinase family protein [Sphingobacteriales bacterium]|nr:insulinase family protein [Sphingobacteriales bacterium]
MTFFKKFMLCLVVTGIFYFPSSGQYKPADPLPLDPDVKVGKLSNGLTYYIRKNVKPEKKVELRLAVNAGSVLENDNQQGLAHFMEHMGFNGSTHFPKNELVDYLQKSGVKFGADLNAYTSFDETVYILPIPTDDSVVVEKGFTVLEDWAFNNLFDKKEIEKERGVVLEESRLRKGSFERMSQKYFPVLFNGSKYGNRLPIGKENILKTFKPETLKSFYKNWYRPNLMAVIVVGDMDPAEAEKKIIAHFSKFKNPAAAPARPSIIPIKARTKPEAMVLTDDEQTNTFVQIYNFVKPAEKMKTWGDYRKNILEGLVSNLINQRLSELTQKEDPPFLFANTGYTPFLRGYSSFNSFAVLSKGTLTDAVDALIEETSRARQFGFLQSELDRAKASMLNNADKAVKEKDKSESGMIVSQYVSNFLNGTPVPGVQHRYNFLKEILPAITLEEINEIAKKMPSTGNAFTLVQAPSGMKDQLPDNTALLKAVVAATNKPVEAYKEKAVAAALLDKDPVAGKVTAESTNEKLGSTDYTLSNGITIRIKPTTLKNDEIQMDAWRWGGYHKYPVADKENATNAAIIVQQMGVKDLSPTDLRKFMAGKTFFVSPYMNADEEGIEGTSSVKDFENFLQLVHLYFTQPGKDESLFKSFINNSKASLLFLGKDPQASYQDTLQKIVYKNNPWNSGIPKASDYDKINLDRVIEIYRGVFSNAYGMHFTFVGNIDPQQTRPLLEKYIGSLPASPKENTYTDVGVRMIQGQTEIAIKRGKEPKAMINLLFEGDIEYNRDNRLQLAALLEVLNIKIIEKLREDMSGMYGGGMGGSVVMRPWAHYAVRATIPCGPENVDKLTAALLDIIKTAREKGIEQKDLDKVKETWKKQYHVNLQSNDYWLGSLSNAYINNDNPEDIFDYEQKISSITVQDLQNAAKKFLTLDNMVKAVMYPENSAVKEEVKTTKKGF